MKDRPLCLFIKKNNSLLVPFCFEPIVNETIFRHFYQLER